MLDRCDIRRLDNSEEFEKPQSDKSVWPHQYCPCFRQRRVQIPKMQECYQCRFAYFGLENDTTLKVGICRWPEVQVE